MRSVLRRMSIIIDVDLAHYFDSIRQSALWDKIAKRVQDPQVLLIQALIVAIISFRCLMALVNEIHWNVV